MSEKVRLAAMLRINCRAISGELPEARRSKMVVNQSRRVAVKKMLSVKVEIYFEDGAQRISWQVLIKTYIKLLIYARHQL